MKKSAVIVLVLGLLLTGPSASIAQERGAPSGKDVLIPSTAKGTYNSAGRRDPFKNLLAGKDVKGKATRGGISQMSIGDTTLVGIINADQKITAIVSGPQGFPFFIKTGDRFADGYVLSITDSQVVFRKTNERGIPLMRSKDITKEINPEER
jgi:Tfp pilus assembly protein PilP